MIELRRSTAGPFVDEPLTWRPVRMPGARWSATVVCAHGHNERIDEHEIANDGRVSPSVVCTENRCAWHEYVKLVGWGEGIEGLEAEGTR